MRPRTWILASALLIWVLSACPRPENGAYTPPSPPPDVAPSSETTPYASITGTLTGCGILILDGLGHEFEPIGQAGINNFKVEYHERAPKDERVIVLGGDFAGESGILEFPSGENDGRVRLFLRAGDEPAPFALVLVMSELSGEEESDRLARLVNYYKGEALIERARSALSDGEPETAEAFVRQALDSGADARRGNYVLARALIKGGKSLEALVLLNGTVEEGRLGAAGYDLWLRLMDKEGRGDEALGRLERVLMSGVLDAAADLGVRGSVYHRRLVEDGRLFDAKGNMMRYIKLASEEGEIPEDVPFTVDEAEKLLEKIDGITSGSPTQLLEERFDALPGGDWGEITGKWKLTRAKGVSFLTAVPGEEGDLGILPRGELGFTSDLRVSLRIRLRDKQAGLALLIRSGEEGEYRVLLTATWLRLYRATPPDESHLEAELLGEHRLPSPADGEWVSLSVTVRSGELTVALEGEDVIEVRDRATFRDRGLAVRVRGGVVDIDDLVVTSV